MYDYIGRHYTHGTPAEAAIRAVQIIVASSSREAPLPSVYAAFAVVDAKGIIEELNFTTSPGGSSISRKAVREIRKTYFYPYARWFEEQWRARCERLLQIQDETVQHNEEWVELKKTTLTTRGPSHCAEPEYFLPMAAHSSTDP